MIWKSSLGKNKISGYWASIFQCFITLLSALLAPHLPPIVFQALVVLEDELLETKVSLEGEVVLQVRGGKSVPIQHEGLAGHELHEPFAEVPHQPLL